jgi:hypothetical protein
MKNIIYIGCIISIIISSCSIEKRVYNSGYHISWNSKQKSVKEVKVLSNKEITENSISEINDLELEKSEKPNKTNNVTLARTTKKELLTNVNESPSFTNSIYKKEEKSKSKAKNLEKINKIQTIKKIAKLKHHQSKKSTDLEDLILKLLVIILILILIALLLSLLGGVLGALFSILLFLLIIYLILKILDLV